jgi:pimeloyl-ACP methyl ester carboxylesterase
MVRCSKRRTNSADATVLAKAGSCMWLTKILLSVVGAYVAVALLTYAAQTRLLFPTSLARHPSSVLPPGSERVTCRTPGGERLAGVRIGPAAATHQDPTLVLGFGGNAWNADDMAGYLHQLFPAAEVVTFHYRGYRPSTGRPSAAALLDDAPLVYDCATQGRAAAEVVAVGFSIGSGVAAHLARKRPLTGLILVTPFDSLEHLARQHYGWLPVRLLLRHHMVPAEDLRAVTAPVALIVAERDTVVPAELTAPLRQAARALVLDQTIPAAEHNDVYADPQFAPLMRRALALIAGRAQSGGSGLRRRPIPDNQ